MDTILQVIVLHVGVQSSINLSFMLWNLFCSLCISCCKLFQLSLRGVGATFGQQLLNLEFFKSQRKSALLAISIPILLKYIQTRASSVASRTESSKLKKVVSTEIRIYFRTLSALMIPLL